ncbi:MAG: hypothetical protein NXI22_08765 [bacterium]|nr:hypothetical protein [bacterium]
MSIESDCSGCGKRLRVADEHRGKKARCPHCNTVYVVGGETTQSAKDPFLSSEVTSPLSSAKTSAADEAGTQWLMRTPEGNTYGPVSRKELDGWQRDGRISADCFLRTATSNDWQPAATVYPQLQSRVTSPGVSTADTGSGDPYRPPGFSPGPSTVTGSGQRSYQTPHRGVLILVLALVGWSGCPILTVIALVMAFQDLAEMKAGRMDPEGRQLTEAGKIIAIIYLGLTALSMFGFFCVMCAGAAGN